MAEADNSRDFSSPQMDKSPVANQSAKGGFMGRSNSTDSKSS